LVEALCPKPEGRGILNPFRRTVVIGLTQVLNRNEYQKIVLRAERGQISRLTSPPFVNRFLENVASSSYQNYIGLLGQLQGNIYYFCFTMLCGEGQGLVLSCRTFHVPKKTGLLNARCIT
jgi:hypothetical protein